MWARPKWLVYFRSNVKSRPNFVKCFTSKKLVKHFICYSWLFSLLSLFAFSLSYSVSMFGQTGATLDDLASGVGQRNRTTVFDLVRRWFSQWGWRPRNGLGSKIAHAWWSRPSYLMELLPLVTWFCRCCIWLAPVWDGCEFHVFVGPLYKFNKWAYFNRESVKTLQTRQLDWSWFMGLAFWFGIFGGWWSWFGQILVGLDFGLWVLILGALGLGFWVAVVAIFVFPSWFLGDWRWLIGWLCMYLAVLKTRKSFSFFM